MKTPDEIKKWLECCLSDRDTCNECPYIYESCHEQPLNDALAYIQQLEQEIAAFKRERDAAVTDMRKMAISKFPCDVCSNDHQNDPVCKSHQGDCSVCSVHCPCDGCFDGWEMEFTGNNFAWRGVCPENTEVK